ncbi:MAG: helix-turn-helix domain-containing protein [Bacilli bacterium]
MKPIFETLMHPVRIQIILVFTHQETITTADLQAKLPHVAPATLYRHLGELVKHGLIVVTDERKIRGAFERTYQMPTHPNDLIAAEIDFQDATQLQQFFFQFLMFQQQLLVQYVNRPNFNVVEDKFGFHSIPLTMTDEQFEAFNNDLRAVFTRYSDTPSQADTKTHLFSTILIPTEQ